MKSAFDGLITEQDARNARSTIWQSSALRTHCPRQSTRIQKYDISRIGMGGSLQMNTVLQGGGQMITLLQGWSS